MNVVEVHQTVKLSLPVADHQYTGEEDKCCFRNGSGEETWKKEDWQQKYRGQFLHDCIHNYGEYIWRNNDVKQQEVYEGNFYANNVEGYGKISYRDGQTFEGLFENNSRFGPGILTNADGTQDVGLWLGKHLVRLNQSATCKVPSIAVTVKGKAYLLNYKNLVKINNEKKDDPALEILKALNANETALARKNELYSKFVRNPRSIFFNRKMYDDSYFGNNDDWVIDVIDTYDPKGATVYSKVLVTHLIAWNNEELAVKFMRHTFKHRNLEKKLSFNVSKIFTGQRQIFKPPGLRESLCLQFLQSCCDQNDQKMIRLICINDLYPDLTDFLGNNGVIYATVNDCCKIIKTLTNFGANIDHMNDECLTSLIIAILRYIAFKFEVRNWEVAFLPSVFESTDFEADTQAWRENELKQDVQLEGEEDYLFDLSCKKPTASSKQVHREKDSEKDSKRDQNRDANNEEMYLKLQFLDKILRTIVCLLNCGSKPNYGDCPFPPLILAIFARSPEIVDNLLQHGADTNIRTAHHIGSLTPLHIVASLAPSFELTPMARHLLLNGANPNLISNDIHWKEENNDILAGSNLEVHGKSPLHLLCMRYDFIEDFDDHLGSLCSLFINFGADANAQYLAHTPLTLAILRGNKRLMYRILTTGFVNPNQELGNKMGAPLTVLILKRYENILPPDVCKGIYETLLEFYANPLDDVPNYDKNSVEFCDAENTTDKNRKGTPTNVGRTHQRIIELLKQAALMTLLRRIYKKVVQYIYQYHIECKFQNPIFDAIVKFLNLDLAEYYLQLLLDHDLIFPSLTFCYELFEYVDSKVQRKPQRGKKKPRTIDGIVDDIDFDKSTIREKQFHFLIHRPELDPDDSKFKVCFQCFYRHNKTLVRCPICQMVYFCSVECNLRNIKRKDSKHPCKLLFYDEELQKMKERLLNGGPAEEDSIFDQFYAAREEMIANDPNYFEKLRQYDQDMTQARQPKQQERRLLEKDKKKIGICDTKKKEKAEKVSKDAKTKDKKGSKKSGKHGKSSKGGKSKGTRGKSEGTIGKGEGTSGKSGKDGIGDIKAGKDQKTVAPVEKKDKADERGSIERSSDDDRLDVGDSFRSSVSDICNMYDDQYFQMFMPYCIYMDGQLYYKFDNCTAYLQMTYSNV